MNEEPNIAIIGAGIAGITAVHTLYSNGFKNIAIFEAAGQIGGRIRSIKHGMIIVLFYLAKTFFFKGNNWIELGAQWIHGQEGNSLYDFAISKGLLADPQSVFGIEGGGYYITDEGEIITSPLINRLINFLKQTEMYSDTEQNAYDYFKKSFETFVESLNQDIDDKTVNMLKHIFRWFTIFEVIDNSCENLQSLSSLSYTEWEECPGINNLIYFKDRYTSLFDELIKDFPIDKFLHLHTAVEKIEFVYSTSVNSRKNFKVRLHTSKYDQNINRKRSSELLFDHVIITSSIGFLKENLNSGFFDFQLPDKKIQIVKALGFGTINKIFLHFEKPFWNDNVKGFQVVWTNVIDEHSYSTDNQSGNTRLITGNNFPDWAYCIQGFDLVRNQPNMLMAWIGSYGAKQIESFTDIEIGQIMTDILKKIVPKSCLVGPICIPNKLYCSRWFSDPYIRGSYSNRTIMYEKLSDQFEYNIDMLSEPIKLEDISTTTKTNYDIGNLNPNIPLILFAGEATDRLYYSTTHGAMNSGQREANRLILFYKKMPI